MFTEKELFKECARRARKVVSKHAYTEAVYRAVWEAILQWMLA
eukprot:CAMPEP_0202919366 /NCGR_PEP_ID=MMETSP1392-20130828/75691_1 /ASSEMBLY_ACC=CAM_ASM_000868 /TAXON_ID=225041 /ORGANISM="Chlamydomonas chlamydogama, Strain SAG 11-48b" /LENGTH=42 /DNA_ID= /DNA_START= /DNA_END= /DNA_ORIENTATION=